MASDPPSSAIGGFIIGVSAIGEPSFAPNSPGLTEVIPSYLYWQYNDDSNLQAFVDAYNTLAQQYVNWFNVIGLPVYTGGLIAGSLLDWIGQGLYGMARPVLPALGSSMIGPFNTWAIDSLAFNTIKAIGPSEFYATTDDIYRRVLTWHLLKGDGKTFNIRWLKRRVMRFLTGVNGTNPNIDQTYQISISFGAGNQVNIIILSGVRTVTGGAVLNDFALNTQPFNTVNSTFEQFPSLAMAPIFKSAVDNGVLELPFQFDWVVTI